MGQKRGKVRDRARKKARSKNRVNFGSYKRSVLDEIRKWHDPVLKKVADLVEKSEDVSELMKKMYRVLTYSKHGVGLAAPQLGEVKNVVAVKMDRSSIRFLINPEITVFSEEKTKNLEGCLSYPGVDAEVERSLSITVKFEDEDRKVREKEFTGFNSVVIQHEVDHLHGLCKVGDKWREDNPEPRKSSTSAKVPKEE